ncbi:hypothetical protein AB2Z22_001677 [Clostridium botulinum]
MIYEVSLDKNLKNMNQITNKLKNVQYISLNSKLPIDVSVGKGKKVTVNLISQKNDQLEIIFTAKEIPLYTFGFQGGISIYDESMNKKDRDAYDIIRLDTLGNNKYRAILPMKRSIIKENEIMEYDRDINKSVICIGNYDEMYKEIGKIHLKK